MNPELEGVRDAVRRFVASEIVPHQQRRREQQHVDREHRCWPTPPTNMAARAAASRTRPCPAFEAQMDEMRWPELKARFAALFATRSRDEWCALLEGTDACFAPVLDMAEAPRHPHNAARATFVDIAGVTQPAPAPRFSRTAPHVSSSPAAPGQHTAAILADWGWTQAAIAALKTAQVI
jgi:alpha-methylacyl-CoA racemase